MPCLCVCVYLKKESHNLRLDNENVYYYEYNNTMKIDKWQMAIKFNLKIFMVIWFIQQIHHIQMHLLTETISIWNWYIENECDRCYVWAACVYSIGKIRQHLCWVYAESEAYRNLYSMANWAYLWLNVQFMLKFAIKFV